eukprot:scaffold102918_cov67-Phaeocystis_antarctica.AAC.2
MKRSICAHISGVTTWPAAHCSGGSGAAATVSSIYRRSASRCDPSTARAASTAASTPARGQRGSAAELTTSTGRGDARPALAAGHAAQASVAAASKAPSIPGAILAHTARSTSASNGRPRSAAAAFVRGASEPARACHTSCCRA